MTLHRSPSQRVLLAAATLALAIGIPAHAQSLLKSTSVSPTLRTAHDLGPVSGSEPMTVTIHLQGPNKAEFDQRVAALYDAKSPTYHKWLTDAELEQYAPSAEALATVQRELVAKGLTVVSVGKHNMSLRVRGTAAGMQAAFHTELHQFEQAGKTFRANTTPALLSSAAQPLVSSVAGLESHTVTPMLKQAINPRTNKPVAPVLLKKVQDEGGLAGQATEYALSAPALLTSTTPGAAQPVGYFYGNVYNATYPEVVAFTGPQLQQAYDLPPVYKKGLDGTGQTIVLLEAYGDDNILADLNAFNQLNGLPAFNASNYSIVYPDGPPKAPDAAYLTGWDTEIALDVEWSHTIAPGAKIVVVAAAGQDNEDFQSAMTYIIDHRVGYAVSNSWESDLDLLAGPAEQQSFEDVLELAAAQGISFNFSTGDSGDSGLGTPVGAAGVPSDSPHATAVGGTSLLNNVNANNAFVPVGWGTSVSLFVSDEGPYDPPFELGSFGGAGGGESTYFAKPSWQSALPGTGRQTPDVSALADPYTGVNIVLTQQGTQYLYLGYGGTSLACPIFTAFWAIAQQNAGGPLGQAAPLLAAAPSLLQDVVPLDSPSNVIALINDSAGSTYYAPSDLFVTPSPGTAFVSATWNVGTADDPFVEGLGFSLDGSLQTAYGWDNVTGYGTPTGLAFLNGVAAASTQK